MKELEYIWIARWKEFQHYKPRRDRGPAWIKDYTAQLDDDRYLALTDRQRALLRDLRDVFAMTRGRIPRDTRTISRHRHSQTRDADLEALNHAGFIRFLSREALDRALDDFYGRSRAEVEVEKEEDTRAVTYQVYAQPNGHPTEQPSDDIDFTNLTLVKDIPA